MKSIRSEWINARGRNAAGFCDFSRVERVERVEGWETVFALGPLRPLRGSRFALRQPDACRRGRMARDHEMLLACRAAPFRPSAHDKPQRHENCLRSTRKRPLRGLHEKLMDCLRRAFSANANFCHNSRHESSNDISRRVLRHSRCGLRGLPRTWKRF